MPTELPVEDHLAALTNRLKDLETHLGQPGTVAQPDTNWASVSSTSATSAIGMSVSWERGYGKYGGTRDDRVLEDWISGAERAVWGQTDSEAVDTLIFHLEGVAEEEVKLRPISQWSSPSGVFQILREAFTEQLTETHARRKFFAR